MSKFICHDHGCNQFWVKVAIQNNQVEFVCCCQAKTTFPSSVDSFQLFQCPSCQRSVSLFVQSLSVQCNECGQIMRKEEEETGQTTVIPSYVQSLILQYYPDATEISFVCSGGMSDIYRFYDPTSNQEMVLKQLRSVSNQNVFDAQNIEERFQQEAYIQTIFNKDSQEHPLFPKIFQHISCETGQFLFMEYIQGESLQDWLRDHSSNREILEIVGKISESVAILHQHPAKIIHRDIKPSNIKVRQDGIPILLDLGIAKIGDSSYQRHGEVTRNHEIIGTIGYMPPEQLRGQLHWQSQASDVFSLGIILYEMLSQGYHPFFEEKKEEITMEEYFSALRKYPIPLQERNPTLSSAICNLCHQALSLDPSQRYPSAREMTEDIQRYLKGESIGAKPMLRMIQWIHWFRKHKLFVYGLGFFAILLMIIVGIAGYARHEKNLLKQEYRAKIQKEKESIEKRWKRMLEYHSIPQELKQNLEHYHYIPSSQHVQQSEDTAGHIASWRLNMLVHYQTIHELYFQMERMDEETFSQEYQDFLEEYSQFALICDDFSTVNFLRNEWKIWQEKGLIPSRMYVDLNEQYHDRQKKIKAYIENHIQKLSQQEKE